MSLPWYLQELEPRAYLDESRWLTLDFEVTNEEKGSALVRDNRVVLASWASSDAIPGFAASVEDAGYGFTRLADALRASRVLIAHNAKFELQWLRRLGIDTSHLLVLDTMVAEYVIAGNRRWPLDLGSVCQRYGLPGKGPVIDALMEGGVCPSVQPRHLLEARALRDVATTRELARRQLKILERDGLLAALFTRCIITPVLADMEFEGMCLDQQRVNEEHQKTRQEIGAIERELSEMSGGINLGSTKQLADFLYGSDKQGSDEALAGSERSLRFTEKRKKDGNPDRTASGKRRTDSATLESLRAETPQQRRFLDLRKQWGVLNARLTKSLEFFKHICEERGSTFYGSFNQCRTQTHRLSSSGRRVTFSDGYSGGVQFQNLPREYKKLFTVRPANRDTHVLVETDGSGLEFRVAAFLGRDAQADKDIRSGADVHKFTASVLCKKPEDKVTKDERQDAKPKTFSPLYGAEYGTKDEVAYYKAFREKYPQIAATQELWAKEVLKHKKLRTASGLILYWPGAKPDRRDGRLDGSSRRQVFNYPIQGLATADIIPIALAYVAAEVKAAGLRASLLNTVHDSIVAEVHKDDVEEYLAIAESAFLGRTYDYLDRVYGLDFNVPLGVGITVGAHWGAGEERKISYGRA